MRIRFDLCLTRWPADHELCGGEVFVLDLSGKEVKSAPVESQHADRWSALCRVVLLPTSLKAPVVGAHTFQPAYLSNNRDGALPLVGL